MTPPQRDADSDRTSRQVLRAQLGDRAALDQLLRGIQEQLWGFVRRVLADEAEAGDCIQDVLVLIVRKLGHLNEPQYFRTWAYRIAAREAFRRQRRRSRTRTLENAHDLPIAAEEPRATLDDDERALLSTKIEALSPNSRAVVVLHYTEELTLAEIADVLDVPLGTVKSRLAYGLARLRASMKGNRDEPD